VYVWTDLALIALALVNLTLTGLGSPGTCIRVTAMQGVILGFVTLGVCPDAFSLHIGILVLGVVTLKGFVFPRLLLRAIREADASREAEPFVGFTMSLFIGTLALPVAIWLGSHLPPAHPGVSALVVPVAFHAILVGLFLIVSRRKAVTQVLGYLVLENGIYVFGIGLVGEATFLVDLGVLLDIFVAVFVMGIAIFHINRELDHIDADQLDSLKG
jgi:hydrogenase-4 component E